MQLVPGKPVVVSATLLRKARAEAICAKRREPTLCRKLSQIVFAEKELASSVGYKALDPVKIEAINGKHPVNFGLFIRFIRPYRGLLDLTVLAWCKARTTSWRMTTYLFCVSRISACIFMGTEVHGRRRLCRPFRGILISFRCCTLVWILCLRVLQLHTVKEYIEVVQRSGFSLMSKLWGCKLRRIWDIFGYLYSTLSAAF